MRKVTRRDAAAVLEVSETTVDRMIARGELLTENERQGSRYRVWVLLNDDTVARYGENSVYPGNTNGDTGGDTVGHRIHPNDEELTRLRMQVQSLQELADYRAELLKESEWRYHELLEQLKRAQETSATLARALPSSDWGPSRRRRWWPFGKG